MSRRTPWPTRAERPARVALARRGAGSACTAALGVACVACVAWTGGCRERPAGSTGAVVVDPGASAGSGHAGETTAPGASAPGTPIAPAAGPPPVLRAPRILYPSAPGSFVDLVANARHGVVAIRAGAPVKSGPAAIFPGTPETTADVAIGTGFLVESHGVYVLTTDHIATATSDLHVVLPDRRDVPARLVGRDARLDVALLAIDAPRLAPLALGDSDELQVGEWLVVLGNAFGDEVTASAGVVSATGREAAGSLVPGRAMGFRTFLQTDARIHRANSGGPVIDTAGEVVGIAVATGDRASEVSFAIPINRVKEILDPLRETGKVSRSWLGVLVQPVDAERAQAAGLTSPGGALITEVKSGSPAAAAGLRAGDIVLSWGDREIDHRSLPWIVARTPVGQAVTVAVWRNRARTELPVTPQRMPE